MTGRITWHWQDEDNNVLYIKYNPDWTWTDHHKTIDEMTTLDGAEEGDDFVYVIIDMIDSSFPKGIPTTPQHREVGQDRLMVIATANAFVRVMGQIGSKMLRSEHLYRFVKTIEEANEIVQTHINMRQREAIPSL